MVLLTIGTGLGAARDRRALVRGAWGIAAGAGHLRVVPTVTCAAGLRAGDRREQELSCATRVAITTGGEQERLDLCDGNPAAQAGRHPGGRVTRSRPSSSPVGPGSGGPRRGPPGPGALVIGGGLLGDLLPHPARRFLSQTSVTGPSQGSNRVDGQRRISGRGHRPPQRAVAQGRRRPGRVLGARRGS